MAGGTAVLERSHNFNEGWSSFGSMLQRSEFILFFGQNLLNLEKGNKKKHRKHVNNVKYFITEFK